VLASLNWPRDGEHIFYGGEWVKLEGVDSVESTSPSDETVVGHIPAARPKDVDIMIEAVAPALHSWKATSAPQRASYLRKFAHALAENASDLIEIEIADGGITRRTANRDLQLAITSLELDASFATEIKGHTFASDDSVMAFTERDPFGIVLRIFPFNHPILFAVQAIASTLIAGNIVILKPPEQCSLSTLAVAEISRAIFPAGTVNVITGWGQEVGAALVEHPDIPRIGFVGSVPTGRRILAGAAAHVKTVTLELGGKNPLIIGEGANTEFASKMALRGMNFTHAGQSCSSLSRILIHSSQYDDIVSRLVAEMEHLVVGDPREDTTDVGPLAFRSHYDKVCDHIESATEEGATLRCGGRRPDRFKKGFYLPPTLFSDVLPEMRIAREEIFGPVVCAVRFERVDEAIKIANDTEFGLNSCVVAKTLDEGLAIAREIDAGTTIVNTEQGRAPGMPFGGRKQSGIGTQSCLEEVLSYTQEKSYVVGVHAP
jgi:acyl-CoA reductase-like NAD-dependent aldehyde dehydrogenase